MFILGDTVILSCSRLSDEVVLGTLLTQHVAMKGAHALRNDVLMGTLCSSNVTSIVTGSVLNVPDSFRDLPSLPLRKERDPTRMGRLQRSDVKNVVERLNTKLFSLGWILALERPLPESARKAPFTANRSAMLKRLYNAGLWEM